MTTPRPAKLRSWPKTGKAASSPANAATMSIMGTRVTPSNRRSTAIVPRRGRLADSLALAEDVGASELAGPRRNEVVRHEADDDDRVQAEGEDLLTGRRRYCQRMVRTQKAGVIDREREQRETSVGRPRRLLDLPGTCPCSSSTNQPTTDRR